MRIKADNRGRISLAQLGAGYSKKDLNRIGEPHTEWEATVNNGQVTFKYAGDDAEPEKGEWEKWRRLNPEHIGKVIAVDVESLPGGSLPVVREWKPSGMFGVLEWYVTGGYGSDVVKVKIKGSEAIEFDGYGLFWVKAGK